MAAIVTTENEEHDQQKQLIEQKRQNKQLFDAARQGRLNDVQQLIEQEGVVHWSNWNGLTPLHAAKTGEIAEILVKAGANIEAIDEYGRTPLHCARNAEICEVLITAKANINAIDKDGNSCLHTSSWLSKSSSVQFFINRGLNVNSTNNNGQTPLFNGVHNVFHSKEVVPVLLKEGARADIIDNEGMSLLHYVWDAEVADLLLQSGASIGTIDKFGNNCLHSASKRVNSDLISFFISKGGIDINATNHVGESPLHNAGSAKVANVLLQSGASIDTTDEFGNNCLHSASKKGRSDVISFFISKGGMDINAINHNGVTALEILQHDAQEEEEFADNPGYVEFFNEQRRKCLKMLKDKYNIVPQSTTKDVSSSEAPQHVSTPGVINPIQTSPLLSHDLGSPDPLSSDSAIQQGATALQQESSPKSNVDDDSIDDPYFIKAIAEGSGFLKPVVFVMHGPPGAGKTSVIQMLLGRDPLPKQEQNSTDILKRPIRTIRIKSGGNQLCEVSKDEFHDMLLNSIRDETSDLRNKTNKPLVQQVSPDTKVTKPRHHSDAPFVIPPSTSLVHVKNPTSLEPPSPRFNSSNTLKTMKERLSTAKSSRDLFNLDWIHLLDSGGQPQFSDVLPLLFRSEALYIVVIRLDQDLDQKQYNCYSSNGNLHELSEELNVTNREMIERTCQIAEAQSSETSPKRVMVIATHIDKVVNREEKVKEFNKDLLELQKKYPKVLIAKDMSTNSIMYPVNAMSTGDERKECTKELQQCVNGIVEESIESIEVPLKWFLYELDLDEETKNTHGVLKKLKCVELGKNLGMAEDEIERSLKFFNKLALHLYHPDFPDMVLMQMKPFIARLSALIRMSFQPPKSTTQAVYDKFKQSGLFEKSLLSTPFKTVEDDVNAISVDEFLCISECLKVIAPVTNEKYFIPSVLPVSRSQDHIQYELVPCAINWGEYIILPCVFSTLVVELLRHEKARIFTLKSEKQTRDRITLDAEDYGCDLTLTNEIKWIGVYFSCKVMKYYLEVLKIVRQALRTVVKHLDLTGNMLPFLSFVCPARPECSSKVHPCKLIKSEYYKCPHSKELLPITSDMKKIMESILEPPQFDSKSLVVIDQSKDTKSDQENTVTKQTTDPDTERDKQDQSVVPEDTTSSGNSALEVFRKHYTKVCDVVSDTTKLGNDLATVRLIPDTVLDSTETNESLSRYKKVSLYMDEIRRSLKADDDPATIQSLCDVLNKQKSKPLKRIADTMLTDLGQSDRKMKSRSLGSESHRRSKGKQRRVHVSLESDISQDSYDEPQSSKKKVHRFKTSGKESKGKQRSVHVSSESDISQESEDGYDEPRSSKKKGHRLEKRNTSVSVQLKKRKVHQSKDTKPDQKKADTITMAADIDAILCKEPDTSDILSIYRKRDFNPIDTDELGELLKLRLTTRDAIKKSSGNRLEEVVEYWKEAEPTDVTWMTFRNALESMKRFDLAKEMNKFLGEKVNFDKYNERIKFVPYSTQK